MDDPDGAGGSTPGERGGWIEILRNRRYLLLLTSGSLAGAGYAVYAVSVLFLAYRLTGNLVVAGSVLFIEYGIYAGTFLLAPIVDRARDKRSLLLVCFPLQAATAGLLAAELHTGRIAVPVLLGLVAVLSVLWDLVWAVYMVAPRIVLEPRQLFIADGVAGTFQVGTQVGGTAAGGALLVLVGPTGGALAYAVLLAVASVFAAPLALRVERTPEVRFWAAFVRGWEAFRGEAGRTLRQLSSLEIFVGFFASVPTLLLPAVASRGFDRPADVYGVLVAVSALGGAVGGMAIGHLNPRRSVGTVLVVATLAMGGAVAGFLLGAGDLPLLVILVATIGAGASVRYSAKYSWLQGSYPAALLGRLSSNLYLFTGLPATIAVLAIGLASRSTSLPALIVLDASGLLVAGLLAAAIPRIRRLAF